LRYIGRSVGRNPRYETDSIIILALEDDSQLRYIELQEKIYYRCKLLGLKEPCTDTITNHLRFLRKIDVLHKEDGNYGCKHYSLKSNHHAIYVEKVFCSRPYCVYQYSFETLYSFIHSQ
jgi:hypothetical protein